LATNEGARKVIFPTGGGGGGRKKRIFFSVKK